MYANFENLPTNILIKILGYLDEYNNFALTCKRFNDIARCNRGIKHSNDFSYLPTEILVKIFSYLEEDTNFALTCKRFNDIAKCNRVIKLDTLQLLNTLNNIRTHHILRVNDVSIIIKYTHHNKKKILVEKNGKIIRCYKQINKVLDPLICSNIIGNTIIILISYRNAFNLIHCAYDTELYFNDLKNILRNILDTHLKLFDYKIIIIFPESECEIYSENISSNNVIFSFYTKDNLHNGYVMNLNWNIPIHVNDRNIYFGVWSKIYSYNYITNTGELIQLTPQGIVNSLSRIETNFIFDKDLIKSLEVPNEILKCLSSILNEYYSFEELFITSKYLAICYKRDHFCYRFIFCITVFNLHTGRKSTIFVRDNMQFWYIGDNALYIEYRNIPRKNNLYKFELN